MIEDVSMTLPYSTRQKYRFKACLDNGVEVGVILPRQGVLRDGDCLRMEDGTIVKIRAKNEWISVIENHDTCQLMRACYHLGNRHVALQIGANAISYQYDHVLDSLINQLGMTVRHEMAPFEPESGAYDHRH